MLNDAGKPVKGSRILILGVSYKSGVGDVRESPALKIIDRLAERDAVFSFHDSYVPDLGRHGLRSRPLDEAIAHADVAVIVTAHPDVDIERGPYPASAWPRASCGGLRGRLARPRGLTCRARGTRLTIVLPACVGPLVAGQPSARINQ